jgi:predicted AlkP superfamily phosphohydrolase/phosphomutase
VRGRLAGTVALGALLVACAADPAGAWGFRGHRMLTRKATATLPPELEVFRGNAEYLAEHAVDPDLWRETDALESPNHFLDLDGFGAWPFPSVQRDEAEHVRRHGAAARELGRLPWRVDEVYAQMVSALRARDHARALERAAVLSHYVGDAHVPLHAILDYNGVAAGQVGVHKRWEAELVDRHATQLENGVQPVRASRVEDPGGLMLDVLRKSFTEAADVLASDRAARSPGDFAETEADDRYDALYYSRLWAREGRRVEARLTESAHVVGSIWLSAWEDAGRPALDPAFRIAYVRGGRRAVLASLDGAGAAVVEEMVGRGLMPNLAALRARGAVPSGSLGPLPTKTAPAHAAIFTGAWSDVNGVAGNEVPVPGGSVLQSRDGYDSQRLLVEPIWVTAARQGLEVTVAQATQAYPFTPYDRGGHLSAGLGRLRLLDGYGGLRRAAAALGRDDLQERAAQGLVLPAHQGPVHTFALQVLETRLHGVFYDDPADPRKGYDTLRLGEGRDLTKGVVLKPRAAGDPDAFVSLDVQTGDQEVATAFFRLFELEPDLSSVLLLRGPLHVVRANLPALQSAAQREVGGFLGGGTWDLYERGVLGRTVWDGGDGTAEERYLETVALCLRQMERLIAFAATRTRWDLLVSYVPFPDETMHTWAGRLDHRLASYDAAAAARLRPYAHQAFRLVDSYIGSLATLAGEDGVLALVSDHGHVGVDRAVKPNVALRRAGLIATDGDLQVDLARTRAVYFPGNAGHVLLNRVGRTGGVVAPAEEPVVAAEVRAALLAIRDPLTGEGPVLDVFDPHERCPAVEGIDHCPGAGRPSGGDLYLSLRPGYTLSPALTGDPVESSVLRGEHFTDPARRVLHAMLTFAGPGVRPGATGLVRHVDVAPTLLALLGIDPSPASTGRVLREVLAADPAPASLR